MYVTASLSDEIIRLVKTSACLADRGAVYLGVDVEGILLVGTQQSLLE